MAKRRAAPRFQGVGSRPSGPSSSFWLSLSGPNPCSSVGATKALGLCRSPQALYGHALTSFLPVSPLLSVPSRPQPLEPRGSAPPPDAGTALHPQNLDSQGTADSDTGPMSPESPSLVNQGAYFGFRKYGLWCTAPGDDCHLAQATHECL